LSARRDRKPDLYLCAVLFIGRRNVQGQQMAERIHCRVNLRTLAALGSIVAATRTRFRRRLSVAADAAVENHGRGLTLAPCKLAQNNAQILDHNLETARIDPSPHLLIVFTSGIVSVDQGWKIALYFTGSQHAGENLAEVLKQRSAGLPSPIQMCDALSRNVPKLPAGVEILLANCLAHGRRQFVEVAEKFPNECRYVLELLGQVYGHEAEARERGLTPDERLRLHQERSRPVMDRLHAWLETQLAERRTEPNSGLGQAISYLLRHWHPLTLFLRKAGAPLDNNIVERSLKRAVLHRRNALFYRTLNGAQVGDLFMSLIHTCQLCGVNSFDYLVELQRHARELTSRPAEWMPWNYRETLARAAPLP